MKIKYATVLALGLFAASCGKPSTPADLLQANSWDMDGKAMIEIMKAQVAEQVKEQEAELAKAKEAGDSAAIEGLTMKMEMMKGADAQFAKMEEGMSKMSLTFTKDSMVLKGAPMGGDQSSTWKVSEDGKLLITTDAKNNVDTLQIATLSATSLVLKSNDAESKEQMIFKAGAAKK